MTHSDSPTIARTLFFSAVLAVAWLLWSGLYKPLLLSLGLISCVLTMILVRRMQFFDDEVYSFHLSWRLIRYWGWLVTEIWRSSIEVTKIVLHPKCPVSPHTVEVKTDASDNFTQVLLGNSITLTPGTLTIDVYEGVLTVHTLTDAGAKALLSGEMAAKVNAVTGADACSQ